jgi:RNA polymerase sigma factor (sigma-70 family)
VDDVAENVLTDLFERYQREAPALPAEQWMIRRALERLDARIRESLREPREQQAATGEPEFTTPEEFLDEYDRLNDMFPDIYGSGEPTPLDRMAAGAAASPARDLEAEELKGSLTAALGALPPEWRRTFTLHFVDGFGPPEIAEVLGTSEDQVISDIETTLEFLRARLR